MALSCALLVGCKREEIRVYTVPKDLPTPSQEHAEHSQGVRPHAHYKVPEGWSELPAEGIAQRASRCQTSQVSTWMFPSFPCREWRPASSTL
jgi:hypothetical protein